MKKYFNKKIIFLIIAGFSMIFIGTISTFMKNYNYDKKNTIEIINTVNKIYLAFNSSSEIFKSNTKKFYSDFDVYYEKISSDIKVAVGLIENVDNSMKEIYTASKKLEKYCKYENKIDKYVISECRFFEKNYEIIVNTYIRVLHSYNDVVSEYNDWADKNNKMKLSKYMGIYNTYIDINKDGEFLGISN